jgi:LysR family transcriptional activator of nhaA
MDAVNLNHLRYFWVVAREGGVTRASHKLRLAQPTISAQVIALERSLGRALFVREGKKRTLSEDGELVLDYANQIFGASQELIEVLRGRPVRSRLAVRVGVADQVSKQVVLALVKEVQEFQADALVTINEGSLKHILDELRVHALDIILSNIDVPAEETGDFAKIQAGRLPIHFFATPSLAGKTRPFPEGLSHVPLLLPTRASPIWTGVEHFLNQHQITPRIVAEVQGVELLRLMALEGMGVAPLNPIAVSADLRSRRLVRLNPSPTGIYKTIWLIAKKRRRSDPLMQHLAGRFRVK